MKSAFLYYNFINQAKSFTNPEITIRYELAV